MSTQPEESFVVANGLRHHVLTWNGAAEGELKETVLLAHGFLDLAWGFRAFAELLADKGYRVVAWDWRGHGESEWVGKGGYYHFPDYVLDLEQLFPQLVPDGGKAHLIAHSMGGTVGTMFAGVRGEKLHTLSLIEGLGPPVYKFARTPGKMRAWFDSVAKAKSRDPRSLTLEDALKRMRIQNPTLGDELGLFLAEKSTRPAEGGAEGQRQWRFDPLHRTTSPMPFRTEVFGSFLKRIPCPTLVVAGEKGYRLPDEEARYSQIPNHQLVEIPGVGHMVHWFEAPALADAWLSFVTQSASGVEPPTS